MSSERINGSIVWVDLQTPNLERARHFYHELLGWTYAGGDDPHSKYYTLAQLDGRNAAGLQKLLPAMPTVWSVYFGTHDADALARKVLAAGGQILLAPMDVLHAGRMAVFGDPTGAIFGVWQGKQLAGSQVLDEPGAMAWHDLYTRNATRAREFYASVFELEQERVSGFGQAYWTLHKGSKAVGGVMQHEGMPKSVPPHWNTYFAVSDVDASTERLQQLGGEVFEGPFERPYGRVSAVADPFGAEFCLIQLAPLH
jgi:predicted enzyme related to lactoylglutathione lyase